jgi:dTDP-4-dehydrorhamnose reductase
MVQQGASGSRPQGRVLLVGAQGQVGSQMAWELLRKGRAFLPTAREFREGGLQLDLQTLPDKTAVASLLDKEELSAILCVGGMTYVDGCESQPEAAYQINARGPASLAAYADARRLPFVYFSTEYVFDGSAEAPGPYPEDAQPNPLSVYGKSKLLGERQIQEVHSKALIVRTTVVYGADQRQKNYLYTLMRQLSSGSRMNVPADQVSTPTYNRDLATAVLGLVDAGASGVFHVCGPERMDRLEFAQRVASELGYDSSSLHGISTAELNQAAPRPLAAGLSTGKLQQQFPEFAMSPLHEGIANCREILEEFMGSIKSGN